MSPKGPHVKGFVPTHGATGKVGPMWKKQRHWGHALKGKVRTLATSFLSLFPDCHELNMPLVPCVPTTMY
jgi:hypothetical protein